MTKNIPDLSVSLHELTPFRPSPRGLGGTGSLYGIDRGKPERSGGEPVPRHREGEYMKKLKLKIVSSYFLIFNTRYYEIIGQ